MHIFRVCFSHALTTMNFQLACGILCWRNPKRGKKWTRSFWACFLLKRLFWKKKDWELFAHLSHLFFPCAHNYEFPACMWNFKLKEPKKGKKMNTQLWGGPSQFQQPPIEPVCAMFVLWFLRPMAPLFQQPVPKAGCMQEIIFGRAMNRLLQKKTCQLIDFKLLFWFLRPLAPHVDRLFQEQGACRKPALGGP